MAEAEDEFIDCRESSRRREGARPDQLPRGRGWDLATVGGGEDEDGAGVLPAGLDLLDRTTPLVRRNFAQSKSVAHRSITVESRLTSLFLKRNFLRPLASACARPSNSWNTAR